LPGLQANAPVDDTTRCNNHERDHRRERYVRFGRLFHGGPRISTEYPAGSWGRDRLKQFGQLQRDRRSLRSIIDIALTVMSGGGRAV